MNLRFGKTKQRWKRCMGLALACPAGARRGSSLPISFHLGLYRNEEYELASVCSTVWRRIEMCAGFSGEICREETT
jgi:hypothetical protein